MKASCKRLRSCFALVADLLATEAGARSVRLALVADFLATEAAARSVRLARVAVTSAHDAAARSARLALVAIASALDATGRSVRLALVAVASAHNAAARSAPLALVAAAFAANAAAQSPPLDRIRLPAGFTIELLARVPGAREMTFGERGTLFVGSTTGRVFAVTMQGNGQAPVVHTIASDLRQPVGVAFRDGALYVSAVSRILRLPDIEAHLDHPPQPVVVSDRFPTEGHHGWKFIAFGPDGKLYVPVGAPCNVCEPDRDRYANIMRMNADGSNLEVYARGIRNSVGFDWDPRTKALWFTNNGRDNLGDDTPPDTLNQASTPGLDFGYPYCHAGTVADPEFGRKHPCSNFAPPAQRLGAHVAALGMRFYTGTQFPEAYRGQIFIAEHGSWNRSSKIGYRVTLVRLDANRRPVSYEPFAEGWLDGQRALGRPADVAVAPDGALLIADDTAGAVYRVRYRGPAQ